MDRLEEKAFSFQKRSVNHLPCHTHSSHCPVPNGSDCCSQQGHSLLAGPSWCTHMRSAGPLRWRYLSVKEQILNIDRR